MFIGCIFCLYITVALCCKNENIKEQNIYQYLLSIVTLEGKWMRLKKKTQYYDSKIVTIEKEEEK